MAKLNPPIIEGILPAISCSNSGNSKSINLTIPFSLSAAVSPLDIQGVSILIRAINSNNILETIDSITTSNHIIIDLINNQIRVANFITKNLTIGQYVKIQLAFLNQDAINTQFDIGYYSTVGVAKVTAVAKVAILNLDKENSYQLLNQTLYDDFEHTYTTVQINHSAKILTIDDAREIQDLLDSTDPIYEYARSIYDVGDGYCASPILYIKENNQYKMFIKSNKEPWLLVNVSYRDNQQWINNSILETRTLYLKSLYATDNENYQTQATYTGIYQTSDTTEKISKYQFVLYDQNKQIIETSGWLTHRNTLDDNQDSYSFTTRLNNDELYYVQYQVETINLLVVKTELYPVKEQQTSGLLNQVSFTAINDFDNGYISLVATNLYNDEIYRITRNKLLKDQIITSDIIAQSTFITTNNKQSWVLQDNTIEQGWEYQYLLQRYDKENNRWSIPKVSNIIRADFEDMFLSDTTKQLKIRFNPKVSSFKINRQEQKVETIGNQFPFFVRNGRIKYKEFPIAGLISYFIDDQQLFMTNDEIGVSALDEFMRIDTRTEADLAQVTNSITTGRTHNLTDYNFAAERRFKIQVLEWLGNGQPKLFRSPGEGNFIVRLMNVSLSPEDKLSRMLHNFTSTAYEIAEYNYLNLVKYGFIQKDHKTNEQTQEENQIIKIDSIIEDIPSDNLNYYQWYNNKTIYKYNSDEQISVLAIYSLTFSPVSNEDNNENTLWHNIKINGITEPISEHDYAFDNIVTLEVGADIRVIMKYAYLSSD